MDLEDLKKSFTSTSICVDLPQSMIIGKKLPRDRYVAFRSFSTTHETTKPKLKKKKKTIQS